MVSCANARVCVVKILPNRYDFRILGVPDPVLGRVKGLSALWG